MILVDNALKAHAAEGRTIHVGILGAGFMARGLANQIINRTPGMTVAAKIGRAHV